MLGEHVGDHGVTRVARADVEPGVGRAARVRVIEPPPARPERVDPVVAVRGGREVGASVPEHARPVEAVQEEMPRGEVLDGHAVRLDHVDPVREFEVPLEDRVVAVHAADREVRGGDHHRLPVDTGVDQDEAAGAGAVDRFLDRRGVIGDVHGVGRSGGSGIGTRDAAARERRVADDDGAGHPDAGPAVVPAEEREDALPRRTCGRTPPRGRGSPTTTSRHPPRRYAESGRPSSTRPSRRARSGRSPA